LPRKPSKKTLTTALDRLASLEARKRANGLCEVCGAPANQVHHYVKRANRRVRFDLRNLISICPRCHWWAEGKIFGVFGGHTRFETWFAENRPEDHAYLNEWENIKPIHRTLRELQDLRDEWAA
jgi:hypothetical protein